MAGGYGLPAYGADGDFGKETEDAVIRLQGDHQLLPTGIYDAETDAKLTQCAEPFAAKTVYVKAISVNVRSGPDVRFTSVGIAKRFDGCPYGGEACEGFFRIAAGGADAGGARAQQLRAAHACSRGTDQSDQSQDRRS